MEADVDLSQGQPGRNTTVPSGISALGSQREL